MPTYSDLIDQWKQQSKQYDIYHDGLSNALIALKNKVAILLGQPVNWSWNDPKGNPNPYLAFWDFNNIEKARVCHPRGIAPNKQGELIVGLRLTLEHDANTFPKSHIWVGVCVRYNARKVEYSFYNYDLHQSDNQWSTDMDEFSEELIKRIVAHLSHDPLQGFNTKQKIGFID